MGAPAETDGRHERNCPRQRPGPRRLGRDIIAAIIASPGLSANEVQATVHGTRANVLGELNKLAAKGAVVRVRDGHKVGFVPAGR